MRALIEARLAAFRPAADPLARTLTDVEGGASGELLAQYRSAEPAAVLLGLIPRAHGLNVLLTQRASHLSVHAGQISLPGGRLEPQDAGPVAAALREAQEEIGLAPAHVEVAGCLDQLLTVTRFLVTPVIGFVDPAFEPRMDEREVEDLFEVPLEFLLDEANLGMSYRDRLGARFRIYAYRYERREIWGVTASILRNFCSLISE